MKAKIPYILYVDDMLFASRDKFEIDNIKLKLKSKFDAKDTCSAKKILGM